jgi:endonuclease YncB( thermonuclease family)
MALQGLVRCLVLVLPLGLGSPVLAQVGTVVSIGDGDTVRVRLSGGVRTVRLACIDAPELVQSPWGRQARQQLQALVPIGSAVELRSTATDRYGRLVAELRRAGRNLNQALVSSGAAFVYWQYIAGCDRQTYGRLETEARLRGVGVWSTPGGITRPWDGRRGGRGRISTTGQSTRGSWRGSCSLRATALSMAIATGKPVKAGGSSS